MRIWSLHPQYLDSKGLVALWRETLLAKNVLENKTKGYKNHPQLHRFRQSKNALYCINHYLAEIYSEASRRNFSFDRTKINWEFKPVPMTVTAAQLDFELYHLKSKLKSRNKKKLLELMAIKKIKPHPLFKIVSGSIEPWEKLY